MSPRPATYGALRREVFLHCNVMENSCGLTNKHIKGSLQPKVVASMKCHSESFMSYRLVQMFISAKPRDFGVRFHRIFLVSQTGHKGFLLEDYVGIRMELSQRQRMRTHRQELLLLI